MQCVQPLVDRLEPFGNPARDREAEREPRARQVSHRRAVAGIVDEVAVRPHDSTVIRLDELPPVRRVGRDRVLVRMDAVRLRVVGVVVGHVGERRPGVRREKDRAPVRRAVAGLAVGVRADQVDGVRIPRGPVRLLRNVDVFVVVALRVAEACARRVRQVRERGGARADAVAPIEPGRQRAAAAHADVHPRVAVG